MVHRLGEVVDGLSRGTGEGDDELAEGEEVVLLFSRGNEGGVSFGFPNPYDNLNRVRSVTRTDQGGGKWEAKGTKQRT